MQRIYDIILTAEVDFARAVALGVVVKRPLTAWHFLIPGMFIFDFLRRTSEIKRYSDLFLTPRKLALAAALDICKGEDRKNKLFRIEEEIGQWLVSLKLYSARLQLRQMEAMQVLIDHYSKLLNVEGNSYHSLVENAYKTRENYEAYLSRLASTEREIDRAIAEMKAETQDIWERLQREQLQVDDLRKKEVNKIFSTMRQVNNGKDFADGSGHEV